MQGRLRKTPFVLVLMLLPLVGYAQLTPEPASRAYFGVNRPIPMKVVVPEGKAGLEGKTGEVRIDLFDSSREGSDAEATAPALAGVVDLSTLFPVLWKGPTPRLRYAQLVVGGEQVGPPVVLQPMVTPAQGELIRTTTRGGEVVRERWFKDPETNADAFDPKEGSIVWVPEVPAYSGLRAYVDRHVVWDTSLGEVEFRLRPDAAPNTAWNLRDLTERGFYTDIIFHRVVPALKDGNPFVVQVGDPTGTGDGGPGYNVDLENSTLPHDFGVLSMARASDPDTNGSQVFIALSREGTARLDGKYTAFAQAVRGAEVIVAISKTPVMGDRPNDPPVLKSARLVDAPAYAKRVGAVKRPVEKPRGR
jgi:cyclophilin family peptidyl-prolyl cis-trans isomerase